MKAPATGFLQSGQLDTQLLNGSPVLVLSHKSISHPSLSLVPVPVQTTALLPQEPLDTLNPQLQKRPPLPLLLHPSTVHRERLPRNQCEQCGRVFSSKAALHKHISLHSGKKLFSCTLCSEIFPDSQVLTQLQSGHLEDAFIQSD